jgi:ketosteroid isomerase-like protein
MTNLTGLKQIVSAWFLIGGILVSGSVVAQQASDIEAVKAANQAFYTALSAGDVAAMQKVWSSDPDIQNIGPRAKAAAVGWESIGKGFERTRDAFPELNVSMKPRIKIVGAVAWTSGIEQTQRKDKAGVVSSGENLATNIFEKQDGRWLMVYHHASLMPQ